MNEDDFEGSIILESLAAFGLVEDFFEAVDSDNVVKALELLREADVDEESIDAVIKMLNEPD